MHDRTSIIYKALDTKKEKIVYLEEFFLWGYTTRKGDLSLDILDSRYADEVLLEMNRFHRTRKKLIGANNTFYFILSSKPSVQDPKKDLKTGDCAPRSIIGKRKNQEDAAQVIPFDGGIVNILCDGMGGISSGEVASCECIRTMRDVALAAQYCQKEMITDILFRQVIRADAHVSSLQDENGNRLGCGTTLLCTVVRGNSMSFVSVGDSHIYLIRNGQISRLNEEHNYMADLMKQVERKEISYESAMAHPKRDALTSYVGIGNIQRINVSDMPIELTKKDMILMCSDGLYRALSPEEILQIVLTDLPLDQRANELIFAVSKKDLPRQDNTTFVLYEHLGVKEKKHDLL